MLLGLLCSASDLSMQHAGFDYDFRYRKTYVFTCCVPVNTNSPTQYN